MESLDFVVPYKTVEDHNSNDESVVFYIIIDYRI